MALTLIMVLSLLFHFGYNHLLKRIEKLEERIKQLEYYP